MLSCMPPGEEPYNMFSHAHSLLQHAQESQLEQCPQEIKIPAIITKDRQNDPIK